MSGQTRLVRGGPREPGEAAVAFLWAGLCSGDVDKIMSTT
jgi:hypothetical protein